MNVNAVNVSCTFKDLTSAVTQNIHVHDHVVQGFILIKYEAVKKMELPVSQTDFFNIAVTMN